MYGVRSTFYILLLPTLSSISWNRIAIDLAVNVPGDGYGTGCTYILGAFAVRITYFCTYFPRRKPCHLQQEPHGRLSWSAVNQLRPEEPIINSSAPLHLSAVIDYPRTVYSRRTSPTIVVDQYLMSDISWIRFSHFLETLFFFT